MNLKHLHHSNPSFSISFPPRPLQHQYPEPSIDCLFHHAFLPYSGDRKPTDAAPSLSQRPIRLEVSNATPRIQAPAHLTRSQNTINPLQEMPTQPSYPHRLPTIPAPRPWHFISFLHQVVASRTCSPGSRATTKRVRNTLPICRWPVMTRHLRSSQTAIVHTTYEFTQKQNRPPPTSMGSPLR
ncbi:hypothetical protein EI94DRAFT_1755189 [Lactarius quietus]|nr:hypothetical protein EI94DRAFT_1755189 [Lactarius quietus]